MSNTDDIWGSSVARRAEGVPFLVYEPRPQTLLTLLEISRRWGERTALVHDGERLCYAGLADRAVAGAAELTAAGVGPGDRVLLLGANGIGWVVAFWATLRAGGIVVLGNGWWSADETTHALDVTAPAVVVADERCRSRVPASAPLIGMEDLGAGAAVRDDPPLPATREDDPAMIQFTSGSTGAPKGAVLAHRSLIANQHMLLLVSRRLPHQIPVDEQPEVVLQTGPLFHVGGIQGLLRAMLTGGTTVFLRRRFDPAEVLELVEREHVVRWGGAPTMVSRVLAHPDMAKRDLSSLRHITLGGAPTSVELAAEVQARFPAASRGLSQVYGMSEAGGTLCAASGRASAERPGVTGRPLPLVELRIDRPGPDGVGEVLARTPTQMNGYWGGARDMVVEDGWLRTGDLGRLDEDGYLYVTGRSKDVIIRGGENIAAAHVEATLLQHRGVGEVAVVGLPDADLGEIVAATVVPRAGATVTAQQLRAFAAERLAHFEVPARWAIAADPLPVNATGKIDKKAVREQWAELGQTESAVPWPSGDGVTPSDLRSAFHDWLVGHAAQLDRYRRVPEGLAEQMASLGDLQRLLFDSGWLRLGWPADVGGLGGSPVLRGVLSEELAASGYPPPFSFGMMEVLAPAVVRFGRPELRATMVPRLLRGDEAWCQGFSEPEAGSDLASLRTRATPVDGGFVINGQKVWTSWAQFADRCIVLARTGTPADAHRGITAFFVDMDQPGFTVRELRAMNGDSEFAELFLDDVFVPSDRVLGKVGGGWAVTMYILSCERGAVAWQRGAWMLRRLEDLVRSTSGSGRHARLGQLYAHLYALRLMSRRTLVALAEDRPVGPSSSVDKILMSTAEQALFDAALDLMPQLLTEDDELAVRWRNDYFYARAASIYGGASDIQRTIVAEHLLGLPRAGAS